MCDHEFVIWRCGNLGSRKAYWLEEPEAPTVRPRRLSDYISFLEIFG
jgi:hypothetical protein